MPTVYITEPGATIRFSTGSIVVTVSEDPDGKGPLPRRSRQLIEIEPHRIEMIALVGRIHITSHATRFCIDQGIPVAWFKRNGDFLGRLVPELSRTADLRLAQYSTAVDPAKSLSFAIEFVFGKVHNALSVLSAIRSNRTGISELGAAIGKLKDYMASVVKADSVDSLLGYEGVAAKAYFGGLQFGFDGEIEFDGRQRRPPPDPANALLSFGYVILANLLSSVLEARDLDPYVGFMHGGRSGRPSLALDMLEELRAPIVDRFVLRMCNRRQLRLEHFKQDKENGGIRLTRIGLRIFFREWEAFLDRPLPGIKSDEPIETIIRNQVDRLAAHLRGHEKYSAVRLGMPYPA